MIWMFFQHAPGFARFTYPTARGVVVVITPPGIRYPSIIPLRSHIIEPDGGCKLLMYFRTFSTPP